MLALAAGILGTLVGFGFFVQAYKLVARRSAKDISYTTFLLISITSLTWVIYGFQINNWPIIIANSVGLLGSLCVIALTIHYNTARNPNPDNSRVESR